MRRAHWLALRAPAAAILAASAVVGTAHAQSGGTYEGTVTSADGRPIAGAEISIGGTNANAQQTGAGAKTDASGHYAIRIGPGQYHPTYATYKLTYNGQQYWLGLAQTSGPTENQEARGRTVCNFELRTHGLIAPDKDPNDPNSYWGGTVFVEVPSATYAAGGFPRGSSVQLTLTPRGPLLDGSAGRVLMLTQRTNGINDVRFMDVPVGAYTAAVRLLRAEGQVIPLRGAQVMSGDPESQAMAVTFPRKFGVATPNGGPSDGDGGGANVKRARLQVALDAAAAMPTAPAALPATAGAVPATPAGVTGPGPSGGGVLGISLTKSSDGWVRIAQVVPGSAAARAGLQPGDILDYINSQHVTDTAQAAAIVRPIKPGTAVRIDYYRGGDKQVVIAFMGGPR